MQNSVQLVCRFRIIKSARSLLVFTLATASYRLLPHIIIKKPIPPQFTDKFQSCFSPGVIQVDPITKEVTVDEGNLRKDSVSREVLRHIEFADSVELSRVRDFFLCTCIHISIPSQR